MRSASALLRNCLLVVAATSAACGSHSKPRPSEADALPYEDVSDFEPTYARLSAELVGSHLNAGWVVPTPAMFDKDSLAFGGAALAAVPCAAGSEVLAGLEAGQAATGGGLVRIYPFGGDMVAKKDYLSRDGVIAASFGLVTIHARCPALASRAAGVWQTFLDFNGGDIKQLSQMYPGSINSTVTPAMKYIADLTSHVLLGHASPSEESEATWTLATRTTLSTIANAQSACYPVRLSLLEHVMAVRAGRPARDKDVWCSKTASMNIPSADWYCGRASARVFLSQYQPGIWAHRLQRCGAWESPDGEPGIDTGSVDWLEMYDLARRP